MQLLIVFQTVSYDEKSVLMMVVNGRVAPRPIKCSPRKVMQSCAGAGCCLEQCRTPRFNGLVGWYCSHRQSGYGTVKRGKDRRGTEEGRGKAKECIEKGRKTKRLRSWGSGGKMKLPEGKGQGFKNFKAVSGRRVCDV